MMRREEIPFRTLIRDGRFIFSKVREGMTDLPRDEAEGLIVWEGDPATMHFEPVRG